MTTPEQHHQIEGNDFFSTDDGTLEGVETPCDRRTRLPDPTRTQTCSATRNLDHDQRGRAEEGPIFQMRDGTDPVPFLMNL